MSRTYLNVSYAEKDRAKALGARWDPEQRRWYAPADLALAPFQQWLPEDAATPVAGQLPVAVVSGLSRSHEIAPLRGVSLSHLLGTVEQAIRRAFQEDVWVRVEVLNVSIKNGHVYLELSERDDTGKVLAKALGIIWSQTANEVVSEFQKATGAQLAPGIKLLVQARPVFKAQFGLSIHITDIDPSYTIGDLEAQKRKAREALISEGVFENNRKLLPPWDFSRVLVVSPESAAGLGDFSAEADRFHSHGVCEFIYVHSRFQGEGAAGEIVEALRRGLASGDSSFDAVIIIRGGGAVNDLAWLNDYHLARFICLCSVPVLTGIGHERDSTLLDEVAHRSFDTPSKVIAGIEAHIAHRARHAREHFEAVCNAATVKAERVRATLERLHNEIQLASRQSLVDADRLCTQHLTQVRHDAVSHLHEAVSSSVQLLGAIKECARNHLDVAKQEVPAAFSEVRSLAVSQLHGARSGLETTQSFILHQSHIDAQGARKNLQHAMSVVAERATNRVTEAHTTTDALMREIVGQGPDKTLARGFAIVASADGKTVTSAKAAMAAGKLEISFRDGKASATVQDQQRKTTP